MSRRVISSLRSPEWAGLFTGPRTEAFRWEGLQLYTEPDEQAAFGRFCDGQDPDIDLSWWTGLTRMHSGAGRWMSRVRLVVEPPSDYTRFEFEAYPVMVDAGDDIRIIAVSPGTVLPGLPTHDFWMFDEDVWVLTYDAVGTFVRAELHDDRQAIREHLRWKSAALAQAVPVNDYLATAVRRAS